MLYADRLRALPANEPFDRELTLSCGAALLNLRIKAATLSIVAEVDLLPDSSRSDLLATVRLQAGEAADETGLAANIEDRRTTRGALADVHPDADLLARMEAAAAAEGGWLEVVSERSRREALSELIAEGDQR